jgi:hypothetical protein
VTARTLQLRWRIVQQRCLHELCEQLSLPAAAWRVLPPVGQAGLDATVLRRQLQPVVWRRARALGLCRLTRPAWYAACCIGRWAGDRAQACRWRPRLCRVWCTHTHTHTHTHAHTPLAERRERRANVACLLLLCLLLLLPLCLLLLLLLLNW